MQSSSYSVICFLLAGFLFSGCSLFDSADSVTVQQLYPLAVDDYWAYNTKTFSDNGVLSDQFNQTTSVLSSEPYSLYTGYHVDFGDGSIGEYYYNKEDLFLINDTIDAPLPVLRYPMEAGSRIVLLDNNLLGEGHYQEVLSFHGSGEHISVPAGTFSCYHFETIINIDTGSGLFTYSSKDSYYAPGVGLIQEINKSKVSGQMKEYLEKNLSSYQVK